MVELTFETALMNGGVPDAGFYSWDLPENVFYADSALASLFGLNPDIAERVLPIEAYLARVHPDGRPRLAKPIRDSIVGGFRDNSGTPVRYVGIVIPAGGDFQERPTHPGNRASFRKDCLALC